MDNQELQEGGVEQTQHTFHRQMMEMTGMIENKYRTKKPMEEAKMDAMVYAASLSGWYKIEAILAEEIEDVEKSDKEAEQWVEAIREARKGIWSPMRAVLQSEARSASGAAAAYESLRKKHPSVASGESSEDRSDSLVNLIQSLPK